LATSLYDVFLVVSYKKTDFCLLVVVDVVVDDVVVDDDDDVFIVAQIASDSKRYQV
jgi:hypothetical protein